MSEENTHSENAAAALDAYEQRLFSEPPGEHRASAEAAEALVRGLLTDLLHYAVERELDFNSVLEQACDDYAADVVAVNVGSLDIWEQAQWQSGELCLRGTILEIVSTGWAADTYTLLVPGLPGPIQLPADQLRPADAFPPIQLREQLIAIPVEAEEALIQIAARVEASLEADPEDRRERRLLADVLGRWAGTGHDAVIASLSRDITRLADSRSAQSRPKDAFALAAEGFPAEADFTAMSLAPGDLPPSPQVPAPSRGL